MSYLANRHFGTGDLEELKPEWDWLVKWGYKIKHDHLWKWSIIWRLGGELWNSHISLNNNPVYVDIGGGKSALQHIFSRWATIYNIDKKANIKSKPKDVPSGPYPIKILRGDFLKKVKEIEIDSVDLAYDSCSITHFVNGKLEESIAEMVRILKPDGYYISATDVVHPNDFPRAEGKHKNDMLHATKFAKLLTDAGLVFDTKPDWRPESFFLDSINAHRTKPGKRGWESDAPGNCCKECKGLPGYHKLYGAAGAVRAPEILRASFLMKKPSV